MADERDNIVLIRLGEIRAMLEQQAHQLGEHTGRFDDLERQLSRLSKVVTFTLGQSTETQFRQSEQEKRMDELFAKVEQLLSPK